MRNSPVRTFIDLKELPILREAGADTKEDLDKISQ